MRFFYRPGTVIATITAAFMLNTPSALAQVSNAELLEKLDSMQQQIDELRRQLAEAQEKTTETDARVEAVAEAIESTPPRAAKASKTTIGGYGELHYNNLDADDPSRDVEMLDLHRFVLFFGHEFNDRTRFYSEVEVEHALVAGEDDAPGEVEIEQAYVEFDLRQDLYARAGVFLIPVGILTETHEPTTFYGVERNDVESIIVPSTWWEGGAGLTGRFGSGWNWDLAYTSGLAIATTGSDAFRVRSGRQKVAEAHASDGAITGRLRYVGIPGLQAALTVQYQIDPSQVPNDGLDSGTLVEAHIDYQRKGFGLRALYARWDFTGEAVEAAGADRQTGWYIEPSYRLNDQIGFYTRYENVDAARASDKFDQWELGLNWWPTENVVIKFDYRDRSHDLGSESGRNFTGFDIGFGYAF